MSLQLRFEIFNLLNHPNFNPFPSSTKTRAVASPLYAQTPDIAAGNPFLAQGGARAMQIGAKVIF